jgi:hypothetical protein
MKNQATLFSRRSFLRGAMGTTICTPLLQSISARAQVTTSPKRLLIFFHPNGTNPETWFPTPGANDTDFTLTEMHQPLEPWRNHICWTRGINMESLEIGPGEPHQRGMGAVLTGTHLQDGTFVGGDGSLAGWGNGISLDQHVANHIGGSTQLKSLELGVRVIGSEVRHRINYAGPAQPLPPQIDPDQVWNNLFANLNTGTPEVDADKERRRRIFQAARAQFFAVRPQLSTEDLQKIDQHHTHLAEMELRLDAYASATASCAAPGQPGILTNPEHEDLMATVSRIQIDQMVMAFACDLTRIGTLQYSSGANNIRFPHLMSYADDHQLSHAGPSDSTSINEWSNRQNWYAGEFAYLLSRLNSISEGDGTLLDNTLILWCSELAQGNTHSHSDMPFILAGGPTLAGGRYVQFDALRHNDLLVAMMNAMGVPGNVFGDPNYCSGPAAGIFT